MMDFQNYYRIYMSMKDQFKGDFTYNYITQALADEDAKQDIQTGKLYSRVIDMDWVEAIEETLPYIDKAIREQRRFIEQHEDVVPIEKAKKITNESVRHLSQHTNLIARVEGDTVTPERILNIRREESFSIYENRFLHTLINNLLRFVEDRYRSLKSAPNDSYTKMAMQRKITLNQQVLEFTLAYASQSHERLKVSLDEDISELTDFERVRRIRRILSDFMASSLMRNLSNTEPVRPPILRTNLMMKNPNFKKSLDLWLFIETYKKPGYEMVGKEYTGAMEQEVQQEIYGMLSFQHFLITISTNPAWKKLLHEKYLEENAKREEQEAGTKDSERRKLEEFRIQQIREEEMKLRLEEIRSREKQISTLKSNINSQKITIKQREDQLKELKGSLTLCEKTIKRQRDELVELDKKSMELKERVTKQGVLLDKQQIELDGFNEKLDRHLQKISILEEERSNFLKEIERLTERNRKLKEIFDTQKEIINNLESNTAVLRAECAKYAGSISNLEALKKQLAQQLDKSDDQIEKLTEKSNKLQELLTTQELDYETQLSDMEFSYSEEKNKLIEDYEQSLLELREQLADEKLDHAKDTETLTQQNRLQFSRLKESKEKELFELRRQNTQKLEKLAAETKKRVEQSEKQHKAKAEQTVKEIKRQAADQIKDIQKTAVAEVAKTKRMVKTAGVKLMDSYTQCYPFGMAGLQALRAMQLTTGKNAGSRELVRELLKEARLVSAVFVSVQAKYTFLCSYKKDKLTILSKVSGRADAYQFLPEIHKILGNANASCAFVTYTGITQAQAEEFALKLKEKQLKEVLVKPQEKTNSAILKQWGIYYTKE